MNIKEQNKKIRDTISLINKISFNGLNSYSIGTALGTMIHYLNENKLTWFYALGSLLMGSFIRMPKVDFNGEGKISFVHIPLTVKPDERIFKISGFLNNNRTIIGKPKLSFDIIGLYTLFFFIFWFFKLLSIKIINKERLFYIGLLGVCKKWTILLKKEFSKNKPNLVVLFSDIATLENITAQYCRLNNIPTATLQHGLYPEATDEIFSDGYELFTSDTFLAWGEQAKENALKSGIPEDHIYIAGTISEQNKICISDNNNVFAVILSGGDDDNKININNNIIMLANEYAKKMNCKYILKPHPRHMNAYDKIIENEYVDSICTKDISIYQLAEKVKFSICVSTTTAGYDLLSSGAVVFFHENEYENYFLYSGKLNFKTVDELFNRINWFINNKLEFDKEAQKISKYLYGENIEKTYLEFFQKFI